MLKKICLLISVLFVMYGNTEAQPPHVVRGMELCNFTISSQTKNGFWLFIDDVLQNEQPVKSVCVQGLMQGEHYVRVELDNVKHNSVGQYLSFTKPNSNYCISQKNGFYGISAYNVSVYPETTINYIDNQPTLPPHAQQVMNNRDFELALETLRNENYDNTRFKIARQIAESNFLTTMEIKQICQLFSFENNKLEFAKLAYKSCVDKNNYFKVNEVFKFDSDKQQLNSFISQH